jgi:hypothetical protein
MSPAGTISSLDSDEEGVVTDSVGAGNDGSAGGTADTPGVAVATAFVAGTT